jgi:hypothetical protein
MKSVFLYVFTRLILLLFFTALLVWVYQNAFYASTLKSEGWLKEMGEDCFAKRADVIYLSASPNRSFPSSDSDRRSIAEKAQFLLIDTTIVALDVGSLHAGIYLHALQQLPKSYTPKAIVMDLNLRSMGIRWMHSGLENSLQRNLSYWNTNVGLFNRINASLKNYNYIPIEERKKLIEFEEKFYKLPFSDSNSTIKKWVDSLDRKPENWEKMGQEMVRHFGFVLTDNNPMLSYCNEIIKLCSKRKIELYFFILPENVMGMEKLAGPNLKKLCLLNAAFLRKYFSQKKVTMVDLSTEFDEHYFYESYPTEHYISEGRSIIARKMVQVLTNAKKME